MNKGIRCYLSWWSDKNFWKEKEKKLVWITRNFKYLVILSIFLFSWSIRQDSFHLELQARFFARGKEKDSCLKIKNSWKSCHSCLILVLLINQTRFCSSWIPDKNLLSFLSKRIWKERWQERRLVAHFSTEKSTLFYSEFHADSEYMTRFEKYFAQKDDLIDTCLFLYILLWICTININGW